MRTSLAITLLCTMPAMGMAENPFGVMTHLTAPSYDMDAAVRYMENASRMAGEWGWVRQYVTADPDEYDSDVTFLLLARAMRLKPVLYINDLSEDWLIYGFDRGLAPKPDEDGGYEGAAQSVGQWFRNVMDAGLEIPYLEVWNEPNLSEGWADAPNPRDYARYHMAVARVIREISPNTIILNAAMAASSGTDDNGDGIVGTLGDRNLDSFYFIHEMMDEEPGLVNMIDLWSSHPYPLNHPPTFNESRYTARGHQWELRELERYGFQPKVLITETGYRLGTHANTDFPKVTDETRVGWLVWTYFETWLNDATLVGICPFLLGDPIWRELGHWDDYSYITDDLQPRPILDAIASLPRKPGRDYMPTGTSTVAGRITSSTGAPIHRALVSLLPGGYGAITRDDGSFTIPGLPEGGYTLRVSASEHRTHEHSVDVTGRNIVTDATLGHVGLFQNSGFDNGFRLYRSDDDVDAGELSEGESLSIHDGDGYPVAPSLQVAGRGAAFDDTDYLSIDPGRSYRVSVRYRTLEGNDPDAHRVTLSAIPFRSHSVNPDDKSMTVTVSGISSEWQSLQFVITPQDRLTQRLRVVVSVEAPGGSVLLDDLMVQRVVPVVESQSTE